jgi:DnaJ family protein C protein 13
MDGWRPIKLIAQLKWTIVAGGAPIMDFSALATLGLNMLIRICDVYPSRSAAIVVVVYSFKLCIPH